MKDEIIQQRTCCYFMQASGHVNKH